MTTLLHTHDNDGAIAFFGGVYGNVPGLSACLQHAAQQQSALNVFLGDATGCCGHSDKAIDLLVEQCDVFIAGNHEIQAAAGELMCGCGYESGEDEQLSCDAHAYAMHSLRADQQALIGTWPETGIVDTPHGRMLLCHGSPDRNNEFLYESQLDDARLEAWLDQHDCEVLACTHTGLPWVRYLPGGRVAFNAGVVGKPDHDGDTAVHYARLTWKRGHARVEIQRVQYDHTAWAAQLASEGVEEVYLSPLRTGWWTVGEASLPPVERARRPQHLNIPNAVADFYGKVARGEDRLGVNEVGGAAVANACCAPVASKPNSAKAMSANLGYAVADLALLPESADMGLGCGSPVTLAGLRLGETVVDLGSGGGIDCILAARDVGASGRVIGIDATPDMVSKASASAAKAGLNNIEIRLGAIEELPVASTSVDAVISNCVINLSRDKARVLREAFRVLKPGGRLVVSDTVALGDMPQHVRDDERMQACCVAGATSIGEYKTMLAEAGFREINVSLDNKSRDIVGAWVPGSGAEELVAAASITARR
jgi:arsenite methyltransferase